MKKLIVFVYLILIFISSLYAKGEYKYLDNEPKFKISKSYVFDIKPYRDSLKRTIVLINMTTNKSEIEFELFYIDPNHGQWVKNDDNGNVRGYLDWENIKIDHLVKLSDIPYIALLQDNNDRNTYSFKLYPKNNKLIIEIFNKQ